ncbi:MAG: histidinol-phosphatase [Candidatus Peribacteraceae bacterium]|nr:histidinol-phosphatase [Candidatus Peribacteraceae bacterium]
MIFDFHVHTRQQDGANTAEEMIEAAIKKGVEILGISEHSPRLPEYRYADDPPDEVRGLKGWARFLVDLEELKKKYASHIEILKGCEVDWLGEENLPWVKDLLNKGRFDYTIGSVHFLGKWGFDYEKDWKAGYQNFASATEIYEKYFAEYARMARLDLFDIGGHFDLIKKFNNEFPLPEGVDVFELARPALDAVADSKMVLEVSSAGLTKPCQDWYPSAELLRAARERGIPVTLNSDAHSVERIAENFNAAKDFAKSVGYEEVTIFHQGGKRESVKI